MTLQSTDKRLRRVTLNEKTIKEEPGRGGNETTPLLTMAMMTIKTLPGNHDSDGGGQGMVRASASASLPASATVDGKHQAAVRRKWRRMIMMQKWE
jgi:hypothetical protein